jgi:DNA-binding response OmpR family regulator
MLPILFIHADPVLSRMYQTHFSPHFAFDSATDGLTGLRKIRANKPKAIISDYNLPKLSGLAVLKFVRSHPELHATPFIFLTNHHDVQSALGHGASGWFNQLDTLPEEVLEHALKTLRTQYHSSVLK